MRFGFKDGRLYRQMRLALLTYVVCAGCAYESSSASATMDTGLSTDMEFVPLDQNIVEPDAQSNPDAQLTLDADVPEFDVAVNPADMSPAEEDVTVPPLDMHLELEDAEPPIDVAVEVDAEALIDAEVSNDAGPTNSMSLLGCRTGDAWTVQLRAVPPPGMGCRQDGGAGQSDVTHKLVVDNAMGGPASMSAFIVRADGDRPFAQTGADNLYLEASFVEDGNTCILTGRAVLGVNFPPDGSCDNRPTEVRMTYEYLLRATDGQVEGTGFVISDYGAYPIDNNFDPATVVPCRAPCSEPLEMNGSVSAP